MGSKSDWSPVEKALNSFKDLDLPVIVRIASAHRTPELVTRWIKEAESVGVEVIIAVAGLAAALPGVVASHTLLPVIGVPIDSGPLKGQDALYSIVQMPPGIPVATVGINNVKNALILALHILALKYPDFKKRLTSFRKAEKAKVDVLQKQLMKSNPRYDIAFSYTQKKSETPANADMENVPTLDAQNQAARVKAAPLKTKTQASPGKKPSGSSTVYTLDPQNPKYEIIEKAADAILDGGIIAIPTDTVYGLACDSTNEKAVRRLFELKGRDPQKPIPVLIDSMRTMEKLVRFISPEVQQMLDELWPGALTVVFPKPETMLSAVCAGPSIGVRIPDCTIALSVISMTARPLAVTSANLSGLPPALTAKKVNEYFGGKLKFILDGGDLSGEDVSTVISVVDVPYALLRKGAISREILQKYISDLS